MPPRHLPTARAWRQPFCKQPPVRRSRPHG